MDKNKATGMPSRVSEQSEENTLAEIQQLQFPANYNSFFKVNPPHWYVLKTKPHHDLSCARLLRQQGITLYAPQMLARSSRSRELKETPLFPGYIFFWLEDNSRLWPYMKWAFGVSYVLTGDSGPLSVSVDLIEMLARQEAMQYRRLQEDLTRPFEVGETVEIVDGPFEGLAAIFERKISAAGRCQVLIEILGRISSVTLTEKNLQRRAS